MNKKKYKYVIIVTAVLVCIVHVKQNKSYLFRADVLSQCSLFISYDFWDCVEIINFEKKERILQYCKELKIKKSIENPSYLIGGESLKSGAHLMLKCGKERYDILLPYSDVQLDENYAYKDKPYVIVDVYENNTKLLSRIRREYCTLSSEAYEYLYEFVTTYSYK